MSDEVLRRDTVVVHRRVRSLPLALLFATLALVVAVAPSCSDGTDGKLDTRAEYVNKTVAAMKVQLRDKAKGHGAAITSYANCIYDVIEAHRDELEAIKGSPAKVQRIIAANDDECQAALQKEIEP